MSLEIQCFTVNHSSVFFPQNCKFRAQIYAFPVAWFKNIIVDLYVKGAG